MRISTQGRYALRAMVDLTLYGQQGPVPRRKIAARQEISSDYLAQLFVKLRQAKLVESVLGPGGGYMLSRSADGISAGDVLRAVNEPLLTVYCVDVGIEPTCPRLPDCPVHPLWMKLNDVVHQVLDSVNVADLSKGTKEL